MDKIEVTKKQQKDLLKLKRQLTEVYRTWYNLSDDLQETLTEFCGGDSIGSCISRGTDLIEEICESLQREN